MVPAQWLERCTAPVVAVDECGASAITGTSGDVAFGKPKGWAAEHLERWWGAFGNGGQRLWVLPTLKLVVAITAGNYGADDQWMPPTRVLREVVLASVVSRHRHNSPVIPAKRSAERESKSVRRLCGR